MMESFRRLLRIERSDKRTEMTAIFVVAVVLVLAAACWYIQQYKMQRWSEEHGYRVELNSM